MSKHIVTVGTGAPGGIDAVVKGYEENGLFNNFRHTRIISHLGISKLGDIWLFFTSFFKLFYKCIRYRNLIIHCHMSYKGSFWRKLVFVILAKSFRHNTLIHLHGSEFKVYFSSRNGLTKKLILWLITNVDEFVVLSDGWKSYLKEISGREVLSINNYVDVEPVSTKRKRGDILFLGAFIHRKGIYDLLNACAALTTPYHLHLCGAGENEKVKALVNKLNISEKVTFHGWVDASQKVKLLSSCSVMILPTYNEGLPMTLIESMGCHIPVITTPVGAIPEVIKDGENGYLVEPGNVGQITWKLEYVLSIPDELNIVTNNAHNFYKSMFTSSVILPKWQEVYERYV